MRYRRILALFLPILAVAGCDDDGITDNGAPDPAALVRFMNVVPDRGTVDLRFIDRVENLPMFQGVAFRSHSGMYQRVTPGARHVRIFPNSENPDTTKQILIDEVVQLNADQRYTLIYAGMATGNQHELVVMQDPITLPSPGAGQIALQVLHAAVGVGNVDVYITPTEPDEEHADPLNEAVAVINGLGYLSSDGYVNLPALPSTGASAYQFTVTNAGSTTPLFTQIVDKSGIPAPSSGSYGAQPGFQIGGSVMTAVLAAGPAVFLAADKTLDP